MKKQTDFKISQVKTFILLPNSKAAATKRTFSKAGRSEREGCNAIPWLVFTLQEPQDQEAGPGSSGTALHEAVWLPGDKLWVGHAVSLCWKQNPAETGPGRCLHTEIAQCGHVPGVLLPEKSLFSFPFPILGELILTLVLWVFFCFTDPPAQGQLGTKRMKLRLCNCPAK